MTYNMCLHEFVKMEKKPHKIRLDYSGFKIGTFKCFCVKCGKVADRDFY